MLKAYNKAEISFEIIRDIGQEGRNSNTFLVHDTQLDADIVIKKVPKAKFDSIDAFFHEAKVLYLSSHSNVVQVHYACQDNDHIYIAMPYYQKGSLKSLLDTRAISVREIVVFSCQIASALHHIHSKKLIHFDVKPDNILISDRGEALLSDFGLSKPTNFHGLAEQDRLYSKMTPPEAIAEHTFSISFDIYQLGLTLYRMCNGNFCFYSQHQRYGITPDSFDRENFRFDVRNGRFPDRSIFLEHIPEKLRKIVKKCLEINPQNRFISALDVANSLAAIDGNKLDWLYSVCGTEKKWIKMEDDREVSLTIQSDGSTLAFKKIGDGNQSKITRYCKTSISTRELKTFFDEY